MIGRPLGLLSIALSLGLAAPWLVPDPASADTPKSKARAVAPTHEARANLPSAVERAALSHVPGASGHAWELQRLDPSKPRVDGTQRIVATGLLASAGAADTQVRLTGYYDPATGELTRVGYRLQPLATLPMAQAHAVDEPSAAPAWSVQQAVQRALSEAMPGKDPRFALVSAQSLRLEDGGRRFDGVGIGEWDGAEGRFIAFTLSLSPEGEPLVFAFGTPSAAESELPVLAAH